MAHEHPVRDTDTQFVIDPVSRNVINTSKKTVLMQLDHNSERFTFSIPKTIEDHDMLLCNKIEVHYISTDSTTKEKNLGVYEVRDIQISATNSEYAEFTWLVSENATWYAGTLSFLVLFACVEDGMTVYRWHTNINNSITVAKGMNNGEAVTEPFPDILDQWKYDIYLWRREQDEEFDQWKAELDAWMLEQETLYTEWRAEQTALYAEWRATQVADYEAWKAEMYARNFAYEAAVEAGFEGTQDEWVASLKGEKGERGDPGDSTIYVSDTEPSWTPYVWFDTSRNTSSTT